MRVIDISQPVGPDTAVWPGDVPVRLDWTMRREDGENANVAAIRQSVHAGTHTDGPYHFLDAGERIIDLPLDAFIGPARVIDARAQVEADPDRQRFLTAEAADGVDLSAAERVLFRTRDHVDATEFPDDFAAIAPALARRLADAGVRLIGTDAPSVDPLDSETLDAHRILAAAGVRILENIVLDEVEPGEYTLIALPLKLAGADSAPVRAALLAEAGGR